MGADHLLVASPWQHYSGHLEDGIVKLLIETNEPQGIVDT
jgi:hypothetical protein